MPHPPIRASLDDRLIRMHTHVIVNSWPSTATDHWRIAIPAHMRASADDEDRPPRGKDRPAPTT
jgi:hypothetical protein